MHFVRYVYGGSPPQWGIRRDETVYRLSELPAGEPTLEDLGNDSYRAAVSRAIEYGSAPSMPADDVSFLAPVPRPGKIVGVGHNYRAHVKEQDAEIPDEPLLFAKAPTSVTNPGDPIVCPSIVNQVDYEVELAVVMGRPARHVAAADAAEYVAGYTVLNDVSARDAQFSDGEFFRGKSFDSFAPIGPAIVAGGDFDPNDVAVECRVNGETRQDSHTEEFIFDVYELVEYISSAMTLRPGDVISTGTPSGVGIFRDPPTLLEPGDIVETSIEGIGTLSNPVVAE